YHREEYAVGGTVRHPAAAKPASVGSVGIHAIELDGSELALDQPLSRWMAQVVNAQVNIRRNQAARAAVKALITLERQQGLPKGTLIRVNQSVDSKELAPLNFRVNGQVRAASVDRVFAEMAKGLEAEPMNVMMRIFGALAMPLRMGAIALNPDFLIVNPMRDMTSAWYREGIHPLRSAYAKAWVSAITHDAAFHETARAGALMSGQLEVPKTTGDILKPGKLGAITVKSPADVLLLLPRLMMRFGEAGEQATRIAVYQTAKGTTGVDALTAAIMARDATVDFGKSGNIVKLINVAVPFLNAGIQGAANSLITIKDRPLTALARSLPLAVPCVLFALWNMRYEDDDDDDKTPMWQRIPDYEYAQNWVLMTGVGTKDRDPKNPGAGVQKFPIYVKIPKGPTAAFLTAPVETAVRVALRKGDRSVLEHIGNGMLDTLAAISPVEPSASILQMPIASTIASAAANNGMGWDAFRRQQIIPEGERSRPSEDQFNADITSPSVALAGGVSSVARSLGSKSGVSPRTVEFFIKDYTGGAGGAALWLSDLALGALGYDPKAPGEAQVQTRSAIEEAARVPVLRRFVGVKGTQQQRTGYDEFGKASEEAKVAYGKIPALRDLGYYPGDVAGSIAGIELTPKERAAYQRLAEKRTVALVEKITAGERFVTRPDGKPQPDSVKREMLSLTVAAARKQAASEFIKTIPPEELRRRAKNKVDPALAGGR
ncbi:MAG TPA: LPD38 domain-containing protein, partial [Coriobacteriia bacterium]|nr:LPD38 domain-containing protein [Coriobacteriia bacterium]